jgi:GT2 family glycosyltransferase
MQGVQVSADMQAPLASPIVANSLIVVVIYETDFEDSLTLQCLFTVQGSVTDFPPILVYDNSRQRRISDKYSKNIAFYNNDTRNSGVAGAYNYARELAVRINKEWLILLDQDSQINEDYFKQLNYSYSLYSQQNLFCPIVISANRIVSPTWYVAEKAIKPKKLKPGLYKSKLYTVINSGVAIRSTELKSLGGYDPDLPLDFSDHYFFSRFKKKNKHFVVINHTNIHNLSSDTDKSFEAVFARFKVYSRSASIYANRIASTLPIAWSFFRALKLTVRFKRIDFLKFLLVKQ